MSEWISVEDRLPEVCKSVLVVEAHAPLTYHVAILDMDGYWSQGRECMVVFPTHWMPLPPPPNQ